MGAAASIQEDQTLSPNLLPGLGLTIDTSAADPHHHAVANNNTVSNTRTNNTTTSSAFAFQDDTKEHIHLLPFEHLKLFRSIPSYQQHAHLTVPYPDIDHVHGVVIFISHVWLRGLEQPAHPDNTALSKYKMLVAGLENFQLAFLTPQHVLYLWLDYSCMDLLPHEAHFNRQHKHRHLLHHSNPSTPSHAASHVHNSQSPKHHLHSPTFQQLQHLQQQHHNNHEKYDPILHHLRKDPWRDLKDVMSIADCIFTPIASLRSYKAMTTYRDYDCPEWITEGTQFKTCYINRAWCRLEMLYAQTIPVQIDAVRSEQWIGVLKHQHQLGRRPHFIYGQYELAASIEPILMPQLKNEELEHLHPLRGFTSLQEDKEHIRLLLMRLEPYLNELRMGYEGPHANGVMHGHGVYRYINGDVYEGNFQYGKVHGCGKASYADGSHYEGNWDNHQKHGNGTHMSTTGDLYVGQFHYDFKHGHGKMTYNNGDVYEGGFAYDQEHGKGKWTFDNGDVYEGEVNKGKLHGKGKKSFANGDRYDGYFEDNVFQGVGVYRWSNGDVYEGQYLYGLMHGSVGQLTKANTGDIYTGKWYQGVLYEPTKKVKSLPPPSPKRQKPSGSKRSKKKASETTPSEEQLVAVAAPVPPPVDTVGNTYRNGNNQMLEEEVATTQLL